MSILFFLNIIFNNYNIFFYYYINFLSIVYLLLIFTKIRTKCVHEIKKKRYEWQCNPLKGQLCFSHYTEYSIIDSENWILRDDLDYLMAIYL